jgi:hypothetical protein
MSGFQAMPNYDFMKGRGLTQIKVSKYTVYFVAIDGWGINMGSIFDHYIAATGETVRYDIEKFPTRMTAQTSLEIPITDVQIVSDDELKLTFQNGDALTFFRLNDGHESMTINGPRGVIVID